MLILRWDGQTAREQPDDLAEEEPLEIRARGRAISITTRTPGHDSELAAGFLSGFGSESTFAGGSCRGNYSSGQVLPALRLDQRGGKIKGNVHSLRGWIKEWGKINRSSHRPFYIFAHSPNTLADANAALSARANALEPDVQIGTPAKLVTAHNANESGKIRFEDYLDGLRDLAVQ